MELIDLYAFSECINLTKITLPSSLKEIGYAAFYECERLTNVVLPDSLTLIGSMAFCSCRSLNEITIPDSITMIDECTFYDCTNLSKINLPNELISIGEGAFILTRSLKEIKLPVSLKYMEDYVFNFSSVVSICFEGVIPPDICKDTFYGVSSGTKIYVPDSALDTYKNTTDWDGYKDIIFSQNEMVEDYTSSDYSKDGVVTILQTATIGNGIDIVLIGDGYSDRQIEDNTYMNKMNEAFN